MTGMTMQERYDEVSSISGLSEDIIRRVYKATRQSVVNSLKRGQRATIPGICTLTPEIRHKIAPGGKESIGFIKTKAKTSSALEAELSKIQKFEDDTETSIGDEGMKRLNLVNAELNNRIITNQISALL